MVKYIPSKEKTLYKMYKERVAAITADGLLPLNSMAAFMNFGFHLKLKEKEFRDECHPACVIEEGVAKQMADFKNSLMALQYKPLLLKDSIIPVQDKSLLDLKCELMDFEEDEDGIEVIYKILENDVNNLYPKKEPESGYIVITHIPLAKDDRENALAVLNGIKEAGFIFKMGDRFYGEEIYREDGYIIIDSCLPEASHVFFLRPEDIIGFNYSFMEIEGVDYVRLIENLSAISCVSGYGRFSYKPFLLGVTLKYGYGDEDIGHSTETYLLSTPQEIMTLIKNQTNNGDER